MVAAETELEINNAREEYRAGLSRCTFTEMFSKHFQIHFCRNYGFYVAEHSEIRLLQVCIFNPLSASIKCHWHLMGLQGMVIEYGDGQKTLRKRN